jgi:hypothetical protein
MILYLYAFCMFKCSMFYMQCINKVCFVSALSLAHFKLKKKYQHETEKLITRIIFVIGYLIPYKNKCEYN